MNSDLIISITGVISVIISSILGPMVIDYIKDRHRKNKNRKKDDLRASTDVDAIINTKLETMLNKYAADRVYLMQFHNGGNFYPTGKSIKKFSMFYEVLSSGTPYMQKSFQNLPISLFNKSIKYVYDNDIFSVEDYDDDFLVNQYNISSVKEISANKSAYLFGVKTIDGKLIGILGVNYCVAKRVLTADQKTHIAVDAATIGTVMMDYLRD